MDKRKRMIYRVAPSELVKLLMHGSEHSYKVIGGLPADAQIVGMRYDGFSSEAEILVQSESFFEVPEGLPTPIGPHIIIESFLKQSEESQPI